MIKNYILLAIRNIRRSASYTFINVSGLALGVTCSLIIFSLVNYHLSFDDFHGDAGRVYRFVTEQHRDQVTYAASVPPAFGKAFRNDYTFGEKVAHLCNATDELVTVQRGNDLLKFKEGGAFADPEFFDIFNFPLSVGQGDKALAEPNTVIITKRIAKKYFGDDSPLGKVIRFGNEIDLTVTGVMADIPNNTDFRSEIYISYSTLKQYSEWYAAEDSWGGITSVLQTFVRLRPGVSTEEVEAVLPAYVKKYRAESKNVHHYKLQPLDDMHFNPKYNGRMSKNVLLGLSLIAAFLIITACMNFVNLATAHAINRSKEVGVRKALGGRRSELFWQFTLETGVIVVLASVTAFCLAYALLPYVNELFSSRVTLNLFSDWRLDLFFVLLIPIVTLLAGSYPGLILSGFKTVSALKGKVASHRPGGFNLRRVLITTQFTISHLMLIGLIVIVYQMGYFKETEMGFNEEAVVMIPAGSDDERMSTLRDRFAQLAVVEDVTLCFAAPAADQNWSTSVFYDKRIEAEDFAVSFKSADENYLTTFGIELVAGRALQRADTVREFLVNETMVNKLGLSGPDEILGRQLSMNGGDWIGPVVGVIRDFHDQSLRAEISPVAIATLKEIYNVYAVRVDMTDASASLAALEQTWSDMYPQQVYEYDFLDQQIAEFYELEGLMLRLIQVFSFIAVFIGCMGLYGLVSFMAVQKTKEIGIRKVLGGSVVQMVWIFGREFTQLVVIAFLIAAPIGWLLMSRWLQTYAYKVEIGIWIFVLELAVIFVIVLLTVGYRSGRAALMNPVDSLRAE